MKRTLAARAADTYVLASAEKIGAASAYKVLALKDVTAIVTDTPANSPILEQITAAGTRIIHTDD